MHYPGSPAEATGRTTSKGTWRTLTQIHGVSVAHVVFIQVVFQQPKQLLPICHLLILPLSSLHAELEEVTPSDAALVKGLLITHRGEAVLGGQLNLVGRKEHHSSMVT
jgi:hypothetical protein